MFVIYDSRLKLWYENYKDAVYWYDKYKREICFYDKVNNILYKNCNYCMDRDLKNLLKRYKLDKYSEYFNL